VTPRSEGPARELLEIRVLAALGAGATTAEEIAAGLTEPLESVRAALARAVEVGVVSRRDDLAPGGSFSLTSQGAPWGDSAHTVPVSTGRPAGTGADVMPSGTPADPAGPAPDEAVLSGPQAAPAVTTGEPSVGVRWRHVVYAAAYVVLGLAVVLLQPVVGVLLVLAGIALGGYTLRPLLRHRSGAC
jgi:hypothetical protein